LGWSFVTDYNRQNKKFRHDLLFLGSIKGYEVDLDNLPLDKYVNRFPGMNILVQKARLNRVLQASDNADAITPHTWVLPADLPEVSRLVGVGSGAKACYILKPNDEAKGNGIKLFRSLQVQYIIHYTHYTHQALPITAGRVRSLPQDPAEQCARFAR
jgi:hypothetical protein